LMQPTTPDRILNSWGKELDFNPGTQWQYSNTNYVAVGRIVEKVGGKQLFAQMQEKIFRPLEMNDVVDCDSQPLPASDPTGYFAHGLALPRPAPPTGPGWLFAAGELAMPASDLAKWDIGLINQSLLNASSYREMFRESMLEGGGLTGYGLGVFVNPFRGHRCIRHSGESWGFVSANVVFPDDKAAVVVLVNETASDAADVLVNRVASIVLGKKGEPSDPIVPPASQTPAEVRARSILIGLRQGKIDRTQLTSLCDAYFTPEAMQDFSTSLSKLGPLEDFGESDESPRGGMEFRAFKARFARKIVSVTTFEEPDGKLEQYLVLPAMN